MRKFAVTLVVLALCGCATRPESIKASPVSQEKYAGLSCAELRANLEQTRTALKRAWMSQDRNADDDAFSVFMFGVPVSKFSGDHEAAIAHMKGDVEALDAALIKGKCLTTATGTEAPLLAPASGRCSLPSQAGWRAC